MNQFKINRQRNSEVNVDISESYIKNRSKIPKNKFIFPQDESFPLIGPESVQKALHDWGRSKHGLTYEQFVHKVWHKAKELGYESGMPESTKKKYNLK